jgi:hypothetical protein
MESSRSLNQSDSCCVTTSGTMSMVLPLVKYPEKSSFKCQTHVAIGSPNFLFSFLASFSIHPAIAMANPFVLLPSLSS